MSTSESDLRAPEDGLRQIMADQVARLHAPPDLLDRVLRAARRRRANRIRLTALAVAVAVAGTVTSLSLTLGPGDPAVRGPEPAARITVPGMPPPSATAEAVPEPPAVDDSGPPPAPERTDLGDLGDGRVFGSLRVGYLPAGLRWSTWSLVRGDSYTTSWNYDGDENGAYCVQIHVYEGRTVQGVDERVREYRERGTGKEVAVGGRTTAYLITQSAGEDGTRGTPSIFLSVGEGRRVEVTFSSVYAADLDDPEKVDRELKKIAVALTAEG
ncbi:hypothetical protein [Streptosporangium sp. NPDC023615]|uniref:hypothetical protein n=1 Tax=Streptosporangium sp. NPDC023615 TaxID=3154794 RepID=UPI00341F66AF